MKKKKPYILHTCKQCMEKYHKDSLIRSLGKESIVVLKGYCSAYCYTKSLDMVITFGGAIQGE